jgi:hypothetical protein
MSGFVGSGKPEIVEPGQLSPLLPEEDSLNESIGQSVMRDLKSIGNKLFLVLIPIKRDELQKELKNCFLFLFIDECFFFKGIYGDH